MTAPDDISLTIRHWQVRGVTAAMAWRALGHGEKAHPESWREVRVFMEKAALVADILREVP